MLYFSNLENVCECWKYWYLHDSGIFMFEAREAELNLYLFWFFLCTVSVLIYSLAFNL